LAYQPYVWGLQGGYFNIQGLMCQAKSLVIIMMAILKTENRENANGTF